MLLRLAYLGVTNGFALLRLLPISDHGKDIEILILRHQLMVLERQLGKERARFAPGDRVFLAALLHRLPRGVLRQVWLLVRPDTVLRRHRDLVGRRPRGLFPAQGPGPAPHRPLRPRPGAAPGPGESRLGQPGRSPIRSSSPTSTYDDVTTSAAPSTSTGMRPDLHGRSFRQGHLERSAQQSGHRNRGY